MSLWYKSIKEITFEDVQAFCEQMLPEGLRLDYKRDWADDLGKLFAAFANTLGGLILLGVAEDTIKRTPIWPPCGIDNTGGAEERITQIGQDAIYPSVRPQVSNPLPLPDNPAKAVVVIRVDESPEAPHAVHGRRKVYERTGNRNNPIDLADLDKIEQLLNRRRKIEQRREAYVDSAVRRGRRLLEGIEFPMWWASVIPLFPWRALCDPEFCYRFHEHHLSDGERQRMPQGSFKTRRRVEAEPPQSAGCSSITQFGHLFACRCLGYPPMTEENANSPPSRVYLDLREIDSLAMSVFDAARAFYMHSEVEHVGSLSLRIGALNMLGVQAHSWQRGGAPFRDPTFNAEISVPLQELLDNVDNAVQRVRQELEFGLDLLQK